jgi:putative colanic acid biosynthesis acetyltransferase WcaF
MNESKYSTRSQTTAYESPWSLKHRLLVTLWEYAWWVFCVWTPKPLNGWRLFWLRIFGCRISGRPFVHQRARVYCPWHLSMRDRACLGDGANVYNLGAVELGERCTVAQEVYLCTGTHDFSSMALPLQTAPIWVDDDVFIGVRALILPGVRLRARSIVGAGAVVSRDVEEDAIVAGTPARVIGKRKLKPGN